MTLSLLFAGSSTYRLIHDRLDVGWLVGDTLVFTGFRSLAEAERAGDAGYIALLDWLDGTSDVADEEKMRIHVAIDENDMPEWIGPTGKALARIIRPAEDEGLVVEFKIPRTVYTVAAANAASRMFDAMHATLGGEWPRRVEQLKTVASG